MRPLPRTRPCKCTPKALVYLTALVAIVPVATKAQPVPGLDPALGALIARCAPTVHPQTMAAVVSAESRGHEFAIADAGPVSLPWSKRKALVRSLYPGTLEEAVATAQALIVSGHTVSLGISQVNDRNLARMGVSVKDIFDPCTNLSVGGQILTELYERAVAKFGKSPAALRAALSAYNSGDWERGAKEGYVDLVYKQVGKALVITRQRGVHRGVAPLAHPTQGELPVQESKTFMMKASNFSAAAKP